jgi:hypothetical protein
LSKQHSIVLTILDVAGEVVDTGNKT